MRFPRLASWLLARIVQRLDGRPADFVIGGDAPGGAYLLRWYLSPWRRLQSRLRAVAEEQPTRWNRLRARVVGWLPNLYFHQFLRDDDDRALHDHPSWAVSFLLLGSYTEHQIAYGGVHQRRVLQAGSMRFLPTRHTHRIELPRHDDGRPRTCFTLFLFGPTLRDWGFHHPERGWIHWKQWVAEFGE